MPNPTLEQLAEEAVNKHFGNRLTTTEEHTLAVQIVKEILYETESKALALGEWRARVNQFKQDLHTRLGVGASGMGHYHGYEGFATFSKLRPVFYQASFSALKLLAPPYGKRANKLLEVILKRKL